MNAACTGARRSAQNGEAIQNVVKSATYTRWKLQSLPMPKARTVRVVTPPEPQRGRPSSMRTCTPSQDLMNRSLR